MKKKTIIIIVSCVVAVCVGVGITLFVVDYNRQQQEEQYIASITQSITDWKTLFANADNREHRVVLHAGLADFRDDFANGNVPLYHQRVRENHRENVISNFNNALTSMENWFFDDYTTAISYIETQATETILARRVFTEQTLTEIEEAHTEFLAIIENDLCDGCCQDDLEDEDKPVRTSCLVSHYHNFNGNRNNFLGNNFIYDKIETTENLIVDLGNIRTLIANDGVIIGSRLQELNNRINALSDELSLQLGDDDRDSIVDEFITLISFKEAWFLVQYQTIFDRIYEKELAHQNDIDTLNRLIADLENLRLSMRADAVISNADLTARINELLQEHNNELEEINARLETERLAREQAERRAREQQQQQQGQQQTAPPADGGQQGGTTELTGPWLDPYVRPELPPPTGERIIVDFHLYCRCGALLARNDEPRPSTCPECGGQFNW